MRLLARPSRATWSRLLRLAVLVLAVVLLGLALREHGSAARAAWEAIGYACAAGSFLAVTVCLLASSLVWRALLADLGTMRLRPALHVF